MKDFAFQFLPGDYLRDTQCLSEKAQVAYDRIMCEHVRSISLDVQCVCLAKDRVEFFLKRLSEDEKWEIMSVLNPVAGGLQIEWVARKVAERAAFLASRASNASGERSPKKKKKHMLSYAEDLDNDNNNDNNSNNDFSKDKFSSEIAEVINHLNTLADRRFHPNNSIYAQAINARLKEGYTVQELLDIVTYKVAEWKGTEFEKYLQPDTLFNKTKCNKYRDQVENAKRTGKRPTSNGKRDLRAGVMDLLKQRENQEA